MNPESDQLRKVLKAVRRRMAMTQLCNRAAYYCWLLCLMLFVVSIVDRYGYQITPHMTIASLSVIFTGWALLLALEYIRSIPSADRAALELDNRSQTPSLFISAWECCTVPEPSALDHFLLSQSAKKLGNTQFSLKRLLPITPPQSAAYPLIIALIPLYQLLAYNHSPVTPHNHGYQVGSITAKTRQIEVDDSVKDPASSLRKKLEKLQVDSIIKPDTKSKHTHANESELSQPPESKAHSKQASDTQLATNTTASKNTPQMNSGMGQSAGLRAGNGPSQHRNQTSPSRPVPLNGSVVQIEKQRSGMESERSQSREFEQNSSVAPLSSSQPSPNQAGDLAFHALLQHYSLSERQTIRRYFESQNLEP